MTKKIIPVYVAIDIDECKEINNVCGSNGLCRNSLGSYQCYCSTGLSFNSSARFCQGTAVQLYLGIDRWYICKLMFCVW